MTAAPAPAPAPTRDTIAAVATGAGRAGIGVVRVSGPAAGAVATGVLGRVPAARRARVGDFLDHDGAAIDRGIALFMPGPASYTGEDVLELQGHGGPVVLDLVLARVLELGARVARPGEFTERAFLNDRLDLAQAEAVADLIEAGSAAAARGAVRSLEGALSRAVHALAETIVNLRTHVEAAIDFTDEEIDFLSDPTLRNRFEAARAEMAHVRTRAHNGALLRDGVTIVIAGRANVGKSSLLNRLSGRDAAIVTAIPGTTRDLLHERLEVDGIPLHVIDTAGLREPADEVERIGIERTWSAIEQADALLLVEVDGEDRAVAIPPALAAAASNLPVVNVRNKIDLGEGTPREIVDEAGTTVWLSAKTGAGIELLERALVRIVGYGGGEEGEFTARRRHLEALDEAELAVERAAEHAHTNGAGELAAEELRLAQRALGTITGEVTSDDLLGRIFSSFCIGK